jgi:hypothetical protein
MKQIIFILIIGMSSCTDAWMDEVPANDKISMYNTLWQDISDHYVFLDQKSVDWSKMHDHYLIQISNEMPDEAFFDVICQMLQELHDGHVTLYSGFNKCSYYDLYLDHLTNYDQTVIERNYMSYPNQIGPFSYYILSSNIGYIHYASFGDNFTSEELKYLIEYLQETKGLIIDIRNNLGGAADNATQLMSVFIEESMTVGELLVPKRDGGFQSDEIEIVPSEEVQAYQKDIIILTNRKTYSSAHVFTEFMSQLPNVTIVGDTTGGGAGIAAGYELANGWRYRIPVGAITINGQSIEEGHGPDIYQSTSENDAASGRDLILDRALQELSN